MAALRTRPCHPLGYPFITPDSLSVAGRLFPPFATPSLPVLSKYLAPYPKRIEIRRTKQGFGCPGCTLEVHHSESTRHTLLGNNLITKIRKNQLLLSRSPCQTQLVRRSAVASASGLAQGRSRGEWEGGVGEEGSSRGGRGRWSDGGSGQVASSDWSRRGVAEEEEMMNVRRGERRTRRRGEKRSAQMAVQSAFKERFLSALEAEKVEEMEEFNVRMREWSQERLASEGYSLFNLLPSLRGRFFKRRIIQFVSSLSSTEGLLPEHHIFTPGDMVLISERHPLDDALVVEGVVLERARRFLLVVVDAEETELFSSKRRLRLDLAFNTIAYERATAAVSGFCGITPGEGGEGSLSANQNGRGGGGGGGGGGGNVMETLGRGRHSAAVGRAKRTGPPSPVERGNGNGRGERRREEEAAVGVVGEGIMATWHLLLGPGLSSNGLSAVKLQGEGEGVGKLPRRYSKKSVGMALAANNRSELGMEVVESAESDGSGGALPRSPLGRRRWELAPATWDAEEDERDFLDSESTDNSFFTSSDDLVIGESEFLNGRQQMRMMSNELSRDVSGNSRGSGNKEAVAFSSKAPPWGRGKKETGEHKARVRAAVRSLVTSAALNMSQGVAVEGALGRRMSLWQGPPGTGKTRTLVTCIRTAVTLGLGRLLACADSNVAVDNMVESLLEMGIHVVRIGQPVKVKSSLRDATLEARLAKHPLVAKAADMRASSIETRASARNINNPNRRTTAAKKASELWRMSEDMESQAVLDILQSADVIACTCVGAGDPYIQILLKHFRTKKSQVESRSPSAKAPPPLSPKDLMPFSICLIDEAAQATLPVSLIPLLVSGAHCTVLAGDPQQLPPTVLSKDAQDLGLSKSLYVHLQEAGVTPHLLDTQYRMHPAIAQFPSIQFYNGRLVSFPKPNDRTPPSGFQWPNPSTPLGFINCSGGKEESTGQSASWFNVAEAQQVVAVVKSLLAAGDLSGGCRDIGIITPYSGQVKLISDLLSKKDGQRKGSGGSIEEGSEEGAEDLEVKTVDGFQGREKEVIIVSTVRSNPERRLGFVVDYRRMNVSITRAKRGLIVIGDKRTLSSDSNWAKWLNQFRC